jgi:sugar/nucleoside kinase (ribokinase family)
MAINQIYAVGAALVDTEVTVSDSFLSGQSIKKGIMTLVDQSRQFELLDALNSSKASILRQSGGSACNSVVAAAQFGANSCFGGKVANDADGALFADDLKQANVKFYTAQSETGITGKCLVMITDDAERTMNTYLGVSDEFSEKEVDHNALIASEWFYIEGYLQTDDRRTIVVKTAVEKAKQHGVKIALSLSDPFVAEIFSDNLRCIIGDGIDLIFCNKDEALAFTNEKTLENAAKSLKYLAKAFAITDGAKGALIYDGKELISVPAVKAKAVNTNGAGDMFAGAFLYGITAGKDYKTAAELANKAAAMVVERFGPRLEAKDFIQLKAG